MTSLRFYITEGFRIFLTSWKNRTFTKKYDGNATEICKKIVDDCWNGRFFQTSTTNFPQFWTRDFGLCTKSLLTLRHQDKVHQTIRYALNRFKKYNKVTIIITPKGRPYNFPTEAVDSLPWFIHSILISKFPYYEHKTFINKMIKRFFETFIDDNTGLVKPNEHFSAMKDFSVRKSSCYDNCMVAMLAKNCKAMKLFNPFAKYDYPSLIKRHFWHGEYFYDDLQKKSYVAGDANLFPFALGIISDKDMMKSAIHAIEDSGLTEPFPLKYTTSRDHITFIPQEIFLRNYESDAIWMNLGPLFVKLVQQVDPAKAEKYKLQYTDLIEKHQNFLEVFTARGKPYSSPFYYCDSGMLWAANYLSL
ncbi:hypothetical protein COV17_04575 [Candidatus Woesearchaeota archaeon CG10_big_fil_rev_8_21_14_0_10_36_11]|nr:MAG: hypothetical protein COV17_04575 [Candidatus Woesearchaeota archaeon CG10_big_fil_rev_8_21_14_0_10_36_11]